MTRTSAIKPLAKPYLATIALLSVALAWGAAFVVMKPAINEQPFYDFLATRFTIAALIMIAARPSVLRQLTPKLWLTGLPLGVILGLAYVTQTLALELTTAAITGFLTGLYVVLTPLMAWLFLRTKVTLKVAGGVALATAGLALISITDIGIQPGHVWGILCAALYAAHIIGLARFSSSFSAYPLTIVQLLAVAAVSWFGALLDGYQAPPNEGVWQAVLFTAIFATAIAFFVQTWAQARMDASRVAIILTSEVVFTALIAVGIGQEQLALNTALGGALMVAAMLLVEWPKRKKSDPPPNLLS